MNDSSTFNSSNFARFLLESNLVSTGKEKFIVHWVRKFFQFSVQYPEIRWPEQLSIFLRDIQKTRYYEDWQIRQADQSVRLYFINFLKENTTCHSENSSIDTIAPDMAQSLLQFQESLRLRNYARRTEATYTDWVKRYFHYCNGKNTNKPQHVFHSPDAVRDFLAHLAVKRNVSASTQNLAFNSLLMFFRLVLNEELGDMKSAVRARQGTKLPIVFSMDEIKQLIQHLEGMTGLAIKVIYGGRLRVNE